jgi:hypothetical protein
MIDWLSKKTPTQRVAFVLFSLSLFALLPLEFFDRYDFQGAIDAYFHFGLWLDREKNYGRYFYISAACKINLPSAIVFFGESYIKKTAKFFWSWVKTGKV